MPGSALLSGDPAGTVAHAERVLELTGEQARVERGAASALAGLAHWTTGNLGAAERGYSESVRLLREAGHLADVLGCSLALADIRMAQGRLGAARGTFERALETAGTAGGPVLRGTADMHDGIAGVLLERGERKEAARRLATSHDLGEHVGLPQNRYRWRVAMARVRHAEGDPRSALDLLEQAERLYVGDYSPDVRPVAALKTRIQLAVGDLAPALRWVHERALSVDDDLSYLREYEHVTLAMVLLAQAAAERADAVRPAATRLLERLLLAAEQGARTGSVIEILVLLALMRQARNLPVALDCLQQAVTLAEPEGYVQVFTTGGAPLASLLVAAARQEGPGEHARRLRTVLTGAEPRPPERTGLPEPLSERELQVLRLLATDLDGPDISRRLVVSLNTVRTHTRHIYAKLGVTSRRAAVRQAAELRLL